MADFTVSFYADWETLAIAAAAISIIGSSMLIMLSRLFGLRNLEQIAKTEFIYAASTVLIVIMVSLIISRGEDALAGGSCSLVERMYLSTFQCTCDPTGAGPATPVFQQNTLIDWMKLYLATPAGCVQKFMNVLFFLSVPVEAAASVYMEIFMSEHATGFGVKWLAERITNTTQSLTFYMYIYYLLIHILNFIKYYAGFFFSIGVVLRAFPPTRGGGAYLMAISFGLYFVFPFSYIMVATAAMPHAQADMIIPENANCAPDPADGSFKYLCMLPQVPSPEEYSCSSGSMAEIPSYVERVKENAGVLKSMLTTEVSEFVRHLVSAICIFPLVALVILFTFVLNTTNLFGGNIPEIGRGLVKLI